MQEKLENDIFYIFLFRKSPGALMQMKDQQKSQNQLMCNNNKLVMCIFLYSLCKSSNNK